MLDIDKFRSFLVQIEYTSINNGIYLFSDLKKFVRNKTETKNWIKIMKKKKTRKKHTYTDVNPIPDPILT